jgi:organic hydroperoxide reductase OsmC/OhrA
MQSFPHRYQVRASGHEADQVDVTSPGLPPLATASPVEFDGPGGLWSPETLLAGAVAACFVLTFRAVAKASKVPFTSIDCDVTGTLDRINRVAQFTRFDLRVHLTVPLGVDADRGRQLIEKAERACLVTSSLKGTVRIEASVALPAPG